MAAIYSIIVAVVISLFVLIPFPKIAAGYIAFAFSLVSLAGSLVICLYSFGSGNKTIKSKIYGYPIFKIGVLYAILQISISILICIVSAFVNVPYWIALLVSIILLALASIGVIATDTARNIIEEIDNKTDNCTKNISSFKIDMAGIIDSCNNPEIKVKLERLGEKFRYSDPVSSEHTEEIEGKITAEIETLKSLVSDSSSEEISKKIQKIDIMLAERNRICKSNKRGY